MFRCCVHYEVAFHQGNYVDLVIDDLEFHFCHKCFLRFRHKKGITVIRYVAQGVKLTPKFAADVPF